MGFRFRKSIKLAPGVRVNLGKKSASVSVGGKGAHYTVSSTGRRTSSVGIPGTGLSYAETHTAGKKQGSAPGEVSGPSRRTFKVCGIIMMVLAVLSILLGLIALSDGGAFLIAAGVVFALVGRFWLRWAKYKRPKA